MRLSLLLLTLAVLQFSCPVLAGNLTANPDYILIPIGGNNSTEITLVLYDSDGIQQNHSIFLKFFDENGELTDKITGKLHSEEVELEEFANAGIIKYVWKPESAGTYRFTLTLWFTESVVVGDEFDVVIEDKYIEGERIIIDAGAFADVVAIPELSSVLLVAAGVLLLAMIRKN